jgi:hypothetical protein
MVQLWPRAQVDGAVAPWLLAEVREKETSAMHVGLKHDIESLYVYVFVLVYTGMCVSV